MGSSPFAGITGATYDEDFIPGPERPWAPDPESERISLGAAVRPREDVSYSDRIPNFDVNLTEAGASNGLVSEALTVLRDHSIYVDPSGRLSKVADDGSGLVTATSSDVALVLDEYSRWTTFNDKGETKKGPAPGWVVQTVMGLSEFPGFPRIKIVKATPYYVTDSDGGYKLITKVGYHAPTESFYVPVGAAQHVKIPNKPTRADAQAAWNRIEYIFQDFPIDPVAFAVVLAALLSVPLRMIVDLLPFFLLQANIQGSGKSLAANVLVDVTTGGRCQRIPFTPTNPDEFRKTIWAALRAAPEVVLIDNIVGEFESPYLATAITEREYGDRTLGVSENPIVDVRAMFLGTGNNCTVGPDMQRRTAVCNMISPEENPSTREVAERRLRQFVQQHRAAILSDVLTIAQAYFDAGSPRVPEVEARPSTDFVGFELIRSIIVWAGGADPWLSKDLLKAADPEREFFSALLSALEGRESMTSSHLLKIADAGVTSFAKSKRDPITDAFDLIRTPRGFTPKSITTLLTKFKNKRVGNLVLKSDDGHNKSNVARWSVEVVK